MTCGHDLNRALTLDPLQAFAYDLKAFEGFEGLCGWDPSSNSCPNLPPSSLTAQKLLSRASLRHRTSSRVDLLFEAMSCYFECSVTPRMRLELG